MAVVHLRSVLLSSVLALSASVPSTLKYHSAAVEGILVEAETCSMDGTEDCALHALQARTAARRAASEGGPATVAAREARAVAVTGATADTGAGSRRRPLSDEFSLSNGTSFYANASTPRTAVAVGGGAAAHSAPRLLSTAAATTSGTACDEIGIMTFANMAFQVYDLENASEPRTNDVIHEAGFEVREAYQSFDLGWFPDHSSEWIPSYAVYVREAPCRQAVVAIKGTSLTKNDIRADAYSIVGGMHPDRAKEMLGAVVQRWIENGYTVFTTGHSLGGYVGEIVSTTNNLPGAVFCAPGPDTFLNPHNGPHHHPKFHVLNHEYDFFGNVAPGHFTHKQWTIYVETDDRYHHAMRLMVEAIRSKDGWESMTNGNVLSYCTPEWYGYLL